MICWNKIYKRIKRIGFTGTVLAAAWVLLVVLSSTMNMLGDSSLNIYVIQKTSKAYCSWSMGWRFKVRVLTCTLGFSHLKPAGLSICLWVWLYFLLQKIVLQKILFCVTINVRRPIFSSHTSWQLVGPACHLKFCKLVPSSSTFLSGIRLRRAHHSLLMSILSLTTAHSRWSCCSLCLGSYTPSSTRSSSHSCSSTSSWVILFSATRYVQASKLR